MKKTILYIILLTLSNLIETSSMPASRSSSVTTMSDPSTIATAGGGAETSSSSDAFKPIINEKILKGLHFNPYDTTTTFEPHDPEYALYKYLQPKKSIALDPQGFKIIIDIKLHLLALSHTLYSQTSDPNLAIQHFTNIYNLMFSKLIENMHTKHQKYYLLIRSELQKAHNQDIIELLSTIGYMWNLYAQKFHNNDMGYDVQLVINNKIKTHNIGSWIEVTFRAGFHTDYEFYHQAKKYYEELLEPNKPLKDAFKYYSLAAAKFGLFNLLSYASYAPTVAGIAGISLPSGNISIYGVTKSAWELANYAGQALNFLKSQIYPDTSTPVSKVTFMSQGTQTDSTTEAITILEDTITAQAQRIQTQAQYIQELEALLKSHNINIPTIPSIPTYPMLASATSSLDSNNDMQQKEHTIAPNNNNSNKTLGRLTHTKKKQPQQKKKK